MMDLTLDYGKITWVWEVIRYSQHPTKQVTMDAIQAAQEVDCDGY
jgi:hypothetical protein